jgi:hypothetical protein
MAKFSERYGYTNPSSVLIRERMTDEIMNAILTCYDLLKERPGFLYSNMEEYLWRYFLEQRLSDFYYVNQYGRKIPNQTVATNYIKDQKNAWYEKLNLIESSLEYFRKSLMVITCDSFIEDLNREFKRLNFAYRIIDDKVVEITSEEEITAIETALQNPSNGVKEHLHTALELLSKRPEGDYRNSIKESISAVEAVVREITGSNTLNFTELERKGIILPPVLKQAFEKLYGYTNEKSTGIRHALMDDTNTPSADEAIFMLVSCSAFINYLTKKKV